MRDIIAMQVQQASQFFQAVAYINADDYLTQLVIQNPKALPLSKPSPQTSDSHEILTGLQPLATTGLRRWCRNTTKQRMSTSTFETTEQAQNAICIMNGAFVMGGKIKACQAQKKEYRVAMLNAVMNRETTLYVKCLHEDVHDEELWKFFSRFGEIIEARVAMSQDGSSKRLALITFKAYADARKVVNASMDGSIGELLGRTPFATYHKLGENGRQPFTNRRCHKYDHIAPHTDVEEEGAVVH
uniref:RRM domain-containing protein n=1 Tax=Steinernema glaseri TaxID=37863 RepID=A0A1I7XZ57_9BILA